jgi:acetolactate synthase-1/3 small subunit
MPPKGRQHTPASNLLHPPDASPGTGAFFEGLQKTKGDGLHREPATAAVAGRYVQVKRLSKERLMNPEKHIITMLVENEPGVTARVSGLFASRGYNIETICGAPTANPKMSRITITTIVTHSEQIEQIMKQVRRLINVIKVRDMTGEEAVKREMALICVNAEPEQRAEMHRIVETFRARIVDTGASHYIIEVTGRHEKIDALIAILEPMGIKKVARSGILALYREPT